MAVSIKILFVCLSLIVMSQALTTFHHQPGMGMGPYGVGGYGMGGYGMGMRYPMGMYGAGMYPGMGYGMFKDGEESSSVVPEGTFDDLHAIEKSEGKSNIDSQDQLATYSEPAKE